MQNRRPRSATASLDAGVARPSSKEAVRQCLHEPAVDDVALVGNRAGVVCGQEEGEPGNFLRLNLVLQRLAPRPSAEASRARAATRRTLGPRPAGRPAPSRPEDGSSAARPRAWHRNPPTAAWPDAPMQTAACARTAGQI